MDTGIGPILTPHCCYNNVCFCLQTVKRIDTLNLIKHYIKVLLNVVLRYIEGDNVFRVISLQ